jgi:hypothetical protein
MTSEGRPRFRLHIERAAQEVEALRHRFEISQWLAMPSPRGQLTISVPCAGAVSLFQRSYCCTTMAIFIRRRHTTSD